VEGIFSEVELLLNGVLGSWRRKVQQILQLSDAPGADGF
jgi:hypothetical protein